jgi:glycosyltransferase involved in cell wall biosynthesis
MKIALLHYTSPPIVGGVENVLAHHARLMSKYGHEVTIITGRGEIFDERIPVHILPRLDSRQQEVIKAKGLLDKGKYLPAFDALRDQIKDDLLAEIKNYDVLIAHNVASLHKNLALTAAVHDIYKMPEFPRLILWHHDLAWTTQRYRHEMHNGYPWDLLRTPWESVVNVAISEFRRQELSDLLGISKESIRVITNGVDLNTFFKFEAQTNQLIEQLKLNRADPLFLLPVRLTPRKNIELSLRIMAELRLEFPNAMLLITGPEGPHNPTNAVYKQKLLDLCKELKLQDTVVFLAEVTSELIPDSVIADFYRLADALLFPSREEGFGIPLIEAAVSSVPVFCANIPVLHELGGGDVSYFNLDDDPHSIAGKVIDRLQSETTSRWSRRSKHSYTWDAIYTSWIASLLQEVKPCATYHT